MGFSFKVAPGVRLSASSRGLRTSIGPRGARLYVGGGRAGFSSGVGPVSFYTSLGGGRRAGTRPSVAAAQRTLVAASKEDRARELANAIQVILNLHRASFPPAERPVAPPSSPVDERAIRKRHEREALRGLGIFRRAERAAARAGALRHADAEIAERRASAEAERQQLQSELDRRWALLCRNDPDVVLSTLEEAFEDNEAPAAAVGVSDSEISVAVLVPGIDQLPERLPTTTAAGNLSLRKLTKAERADLYTLLVFGHLLATVRETFAVAPGADSVRTVALRRGGLDAYGRIRAECIVAARILRAALDGVQWDVVDAATIMTGIADELVTARRRQSQELQPIELTREPELAALVQLVDLAQLSEHAETQGN